MSDSSARLLAVLERLRGAGTELHGQEARAVAQVIHGLPVPAPDDIRLLFLVASPLDVGRVEVFSLGDLETVNLDAGLREYLGSAFFFASDGGDGFFFCDVRGSLGPREGIVWVDRNAAMGDECVPCGADLAEFLERAAAGEEPWTGPTFGERWAGETRAFLERGAAELLAPAPEEQVAAAAERLEVWFPPALEALLERSDGLALPGAGVRLYGAGEIRVAARSSDGSPDALWIGERRAAGTAGSEEPAERYALSLPGWRRLAPGIVVAAPASSPAESGTILGPLPRALEHWAAQAASAGDKR